MSSKKTPRAARLRRHASLRKKLAGTGARPRLAVFRSNQHIYAQVIDDEAGRTLVAASDVERELREAEAASKASRAAHVGQLVARRAKEAGVSTVVFDRGGFAYRGRVRALAEAAREEGLEF
jgi:large subunit ribosomal protein L18